MKPIYFANPADLRKWFEMNHHKETEIWVGYYKKSTGKPSITWPQSVDQALCFGWIDGIRKSIDLKRYVIRFTPRKPGSNWSNVNINKVNELVKQGLMQPEGLSAYEKKDDNKSRVYSFEQGSVKFSREYETIFMKNKKAWDFFQSMPPSYRKPCIHWVMSAKQEETRLKRLNILINDSSEENAIAPMRWNKNYKSSNGSGIKR